MISINRVLHYLPDSDKIWYFDVSKSGFGNSYRLVIDNKALFYPAPDHITNVEMIYAEDGYIEFKNNLGSIDTIDFNKVKFK